jgi:hypothetical protein
LIHCSVGESREGDKGTKAIKESKKNDEGID